MLLGTIERDSLGNLSPIGMGVQYIFRPHAWDESTGSSVLRRRRVASLSMDLFG